MGGRFGVVECHTIPKVFDRAPVVDSKCRLCENVSPVATAEMASRGYVTARKPQCCLKLDVYLSNAGDLAPGEHGEVFVSPPGHEIDPDIGRYITHGCDPDKSKRLDLGRVIELQLGKRRAETRHRLKN